MINTSRFFVALGVLSVIAACKGAESPVAPAAVDCPTNGSRACTETSDCGAAGLHCTGGHCYANQAGCACSNGADCGGGAHCAKGMCYANVVGVPCTESTECGLKAHCSGGACYANNTGSPCSAEPDCGPGSACVSGTCN